MINKVLYILLFIGFNSQAQEFLGMWEVVSVEVGDFKNTPQAKWILFEEEGFRSGNGFLKNGAGTYTYQHKTKALKIQDSLGFEDSNGPFIVSFEGETMIWQRNEDEGLVTVRLERRSELPMRPLDRIIGIWLPEEPDSISYVFLSWTRNYRIRFADGRTENGVWHAHAHRPELIFLPWDRSKKSRSYWIETGPWEELLLKSAADESQQHHYSRVRSFPED